MKIAFLALAALCGALLSLLMAIMVTGRIPLRPAPAAPAAVAAPHAPAPVRFLGEDTLDELMAALRHAQTNYLAKTRALADREEEARLEQQVLSRLAEDLTRLRDETRQGLVAIETQERVNLRQVAEVYGRMEPERAAAVLGEMDSQRAATILSMVNDRRAAAIFDAAVSSGEKGAVRAADWTDVMRRMKTETAPAGEKGT